jgi:hypothetical protein
MTRIAERGWNQLEAIDLCRKLEEIAPKYGGHIALTGGLLYKDGERKDIDILIYRSADEPEFNWDDFFAEIELTLGITLQKDFGWCKKALSHGKRYIDFFDPFKGGEHRSSEDVT